MIAETWILEPHACGVCFGRVLSRKAEGAPRIFRCSCCGVEGEARAASICACGLKIGNRLMGTRCRTNPDPRPEMPAEIIAIDEGET